MTTFDKREEGFEKKFAHERSSSSSRMRGATGCSAVGGRELGLAGAQADAYAKEVVIADFETPGTTTVPKDPQGFRRQGRRAVRSSDPPYHGRAHGPGGRGNQGERIVDSEAVGIVLNILSAFSLAVSPAQRRDRPQWLVRFALSDPRRAPRTRGIPRSHPGRTTRLVGHRIVWWRRSRRCGQGGAAPIVRVPLGDFATGEPRCSISAQRESSRR